MIFNIKYDKNIDFTLLCEKIDNHTAFGCFFNDDDIIEKDINLKNISHCINFIEFNDDNIDLNIEIIKTDSGNLLKIFIYNEMVDFIPRIFDNKVFTIDAIIMDCIKIRIKKIKKLKRLIDEKNNF